MPRDRIGLICRNQRELNDGGAALFAGILSSLKSSAPDTKCLPVRAATGGLLHWIGGSEKPISEAIVSNLKIV